VEVPEFIVVLIFSWTSANYCYCSQVFIKLRAYPEAVVPNVCNRRHRCVSVGLNTSCSAVWTP